MNTLILRLHLLNQFLQQSQQIRSSLLQELIDNATDPIIRMRRFSMLHDLSVYEADIIEKIRSFDADYDDFEKAISSAQMGLSMVTNRAA
jgi:hypothetical protein